MCPFAPQYELSEPPHMCPFAPQAYQVYAMRSAEDVYKLLTAHKSSYVIIEESLCNEMSPAKGCRVKDLLDYSNGHVSDTPDAQVHYTFHLSSFGSRFYPQ